MTILTIFTFFALFCVKKTHSDSLITHNHIWSHLLVQLDQLHTAKTRRCVDPAMIRHSCCPFQSLGSLHWLQFPALLTWPGSGSNLEIVCRFSEWKLHL